MIKCPDCGAFISERAVACPKCGAPMTPSVPPQTPPMSTPQPVDPSAIENANVSATENREPESEPEYDEEMKNHLPTALTIALCTYAGVLLLDCLMAFLPVAREFVPFDLWRGCRLIASIAILIGALMYRKNKNVIWATVIGFFIMTITNINGLVSECQYIRHQNTYAVAYADSDTVAVEPVIAEEPYVQDYTGGDTAVADDSYIPPSSRIHNGSQYAFDFEVGGISLHLSFNKEDETARLEVDGKTFYGTCGHDGLFREGQIEVGGFDGADDYDIHKGGERCYWGNGVWIDYKHNYLYVTQNAAKAYNPDYRIRLTPSN